MDKWTMESSIQGCPCCLASTGGLSYCALVRSATQEAAMHWLGGPQCTGWVGSNALVGQAAMHGWVLRRQGLAFMAGLAHKASLGGLHTITCPRLFLTLRSAADPARLHLERHRSHAVLRVQHHGYTRCAGRRQTSLPTTLHAWCVVAFKLDSLADISSYLLLPAQHSTTHQTTPSLTSSATTAWCVWPPLQQTSPRKPTCSQIHSLCPAQVGRVPGSPGTAAPSSRTLHMLALPGPPCFNSLASHVCRCLIQTRSPSSSSPRSTRWPRCQASRHSRPSTPDMPSTPGRRSRRSITI